MMRLATPLHNLLALSWPMLILLALVPDQNLILFLIKQAFSWWRLVKAYANFANRSQAATLSLTFAEWSVMRNRPRSSSSTSTSTSCISSLDDNHLGDDEIKLRWARHLKCLGPADRELARDFFIR